MTRFSAGIENNALYFVIALLVPYRKSITEHSKTLCYARAKYINITSFIHKGNTVVLESSNARKTSIQL